MPLYAIIGTPIHFTLTDKNAEAYNRVDSLLFKLSTPYSKHGPVLIEPEDLYSWREVANVIRALNKVSSGFAFDHSQTGNEYTPPLRKV